MQRLLILATALTLTACSARPTVLPPVAPPANALTRCADPRNPETGEHHESYLAYVLDLFYDCAMRHDALVNYTEKKK